MPSMPPSAQDAHPTHTPTAVEVLAEEFYLVVMQATRDHWLTWEHVSFDVKTGYYDLAHEVAERLHGLGGGE